MKPKFIVGIFAAIAVMTLTVKVTTERDGYLGDLLQSVDIFESFAPAPTTDTTVGRLELVHPDLGHDGGAVLHTKVRDAWTKISNNMNSRYQEYSGVADSAVTTYRHNFGVAFTEVTVLIYTGSGTNLTRVTTVGQAGDYQVAANITNPKLDIDITAPTSGGPHTFAIIVIHGSAVEVLDNLNDVDVTTTAPEEGQALVYSSGTWVPGASGDASLKCQDVTDPNVTIKSGNMWIKNGQEVQVTSDLTVSLDTILGSDPVDDTTYYLYIDLDALAAPTLTATGRSVRLLTTASELALLTTIPENSQLSRYVPLCKIHSADTGTVWSGTGADVETLSFRIYEGPSVTVSPTVYELSKTSIGTVGTAGQIRAGHVLTDDSFRAYTTDISYYNLTGLTDNSTNARTLSNNNSVVFTGNDIFGSSGIATFNGANNLFSNDAFYSSALSSTWSISGWFKASDWSDAGTLISVWDGTPNIGPRIETFSGNLRYSASDDGTASDFIDVAIPNVIDDDWHHVAMVYDGTFLLGYFDGKEVARFVFAGQAAITGTFAIGARYVSGVAGGFFTGQAQEVYFVDGSMDAQEIRKTYAAKIPHNANIPVENQSWFGTFYNSNDEVISDLQNDWLVAKEENVIYTDLDFSSALLRMQDHSITTTVVPVETYTTGKLSSAPSFPIAHGLPCTPKDFYVLTEGQSIAGDWDKRYDLLSSDSVNIEGDVSSLTIDASHRLEIVASCAPIAVAVPVADATNHGTVTSYAPTVKSSVRTDTDADYTILDNDGYGTFLYSIGGSDSTITLPTLADNQGRIFYFSKTNPDVGGDLVIDGEGAETIDGALDYHIHGPNGGLKIIAGNTEWIILESPKDILVDETTTAWGTSNTQYASLTLTPGTWSLSSFDYIGADATNRYLESNIATSVGGGSIDNGTKVVGDFYWTAQGIGSIQVNEAIVTITSDTSYILSGLASSISGNSASRHHLKAVRLR